MAFTLIVNNNVSYCKELAFICVKLYGHEDISSPSLEVLHR